MNNWNAGSSENSGVRSDPPPFQSYGVDLTVVEWDPSRANQSNLFIKPELLLLRLWIITLLTKMKTAKQHVLPKHLFWTKGVIGVLFPIIHCGRQTHIYHTKGHFKAPLLPATAMRCTCDGSSRGGRSVCLYNYCVTMLILKVRLTLS